MSVKTVKVKRKNGTAAKRKRTKAQGAEDFEVYLTRIVNDPNAPRIAKYLAALMFRTKEVKVISLL